MEWIIGIYFVVGVWKAWGMLLSEASERPMWTYSARNPLTWTLYLVAWVIVWPWGESKRKRG